MAINSVSSNGGVQNTQGPSSSELNNFQKDLGGKSTEDVAKLATDQTLPAWQRDKAMGELLNRAEKMTQPANSELDPQEKDQLKEMLEQLGKGGKGGKGEKAAGNEGSDLLAKLLQAMGVPGDVAQKLGEAFADSKSKGDGAV